MNKNDFFKLLGRNLCSYNISEEVQKEILSEFEVHIKSAIDSGKTEEEAVNSLGDPHEIAKDYKIIGHIDSIIKKPSLIEICMLICKSLIGGLVGFYAVILILVAQLFLFLMMSIGVLLGLAGILCFIGIVVPYVRNNWVLVELEVSLVLKITIMLLFGILLPKLGIMIVKYFYSANKKFYQKIASYLRKYFYGFIKNKHSNKYL